MVLPRTRALRFVAARTEDIKLTSCSQKTPKSIYEPRFSLRRNVDELTVMIESKETKNMVRYFVPYAKGRKDVIPG